MENENKNNSKAILNDILIFLAKDTNSIESVSIMQPQLLKGLELWLSPMDNVDDVDDNIDDDNYEENQKIRQSKNQSGFVLQF